MCQKSGFRKKYHIPDFDKSICPARTVIIPFFVEISLRLNNERVVYLNMSSAFCKL